MIEKENEYINRMLRKTEFEPVPIPDESEDKTMYKFEKETADYELDTRR